MVGITLSAAFTLLHETFRWFLFMGSGSANHLFADAIHVVWLKIHFCLFPSLATTHDSHSANHLIDCDVNKHASHSNDTSHMPGRTSAIFLAIVCMQHDYTEAISCHRQNVNRVPCSFQTDSSISHSQQHYQYWLTLAKLSIYGRVFVFAIWTTWTDQLQ